MKNQQKEYKPSFERWAAYYDAIYEAQGKDYQKEADKIHEIVARYKKSPGNRLLDVDSGTGGHFPYLSQWYAVHPAPCRRRFLAGFNFAVAELIPFKSQNLHILA